MGAILPPESLYKAELFKILHNLAPIWLSILTAATPPIELVLDLPASTSVSPVGSALRQEGKE